MTIPTHAAATAVLALMTMDASRAQLPTAVPPDVTPLCQSIRAWVSSDAQAAAGNAQAAAPALLGPTFTQHFGKEYAQLTPADFAALRGQGMTSCSRSRVLATGQMRTATMLLTPSFQRQWLASGTVSGDRQALPSRLPATAGMQGSVLGSPGLSPTQGRAGATQASAGTASPAVREGTGIGRAAYPAQPTLGNATGASATTTTATTSVKGITADAKSSFATALSGLATSAIASGTEALQSGASRIGGTGPTATKVPGCPSEADMEVIRRTGAKPPEGCPP